MSTTLERALPAQNSMYALGRVDGYPKVSGQTRYTADMKLPGMLYAVVVRSPYAHARIVAIHKEAAEALPGVHAVISGEDIPYGTYGRNVCDIPVLAKGVVRFAGERVVAVAAETIEIAQEAAALVEIEYEPLPALTDPAEALESDAPVVHEEPWRYPFAVVTAEDHPNLQSRQTWAHGGDVEEALANSWRVFEHTFHTQAQHQGYLETHGCIVRVTSDAVEIWAPNKGPYRIRQQLSRWMNVDPGKIQVKSMAVGGDFGGKGSPMEIPLCIVLAEKTGRAVKMQMRYAEDLMAANPRHPATTKVRLGIDEQHRITALDVDVQMDGGAYAGFKPIPSANLSGAAEAGNSYRVPAIRIESRITYSHTVPKGHMRSPGSIQVNFPVESMMDMVARELGLDPVQFRADNMMRDGDRGTLGEEWLEVRNELTLEAALEALKESDANPTLRPTLEGDWVSGTGIAFYNRDTHGGKTEVALEPQTDGSIVVWVPFPDQGAGQFTVARNVVQSQLGLPIDKIHIRQADLDDFTFDSGVGASRVTVDSAEALVQACRKLEERLREEPGVGLDEDLASLSPERLSDMLAQFANVTDGERIISGLDHTVIPRVTSSCIHIAKVRVDRNTGEVVVDELITALDVASVLNPPSHMAQIIGGIVTAYSGAVLEDLLIQDGKVTAANLGDYKLPSVQDLPHLTVRMVEGGRGIGEQNVKAIGELTNVAVMPAIANAVADAVGVRVDSLPITAEKVYFALHSEEDGR